MSPVLAAQGLSKRFGGKLAVDCVSLDVHSAEVVGLLGPNGAGKTTTFDMIAGAVPPSEGRVLYDDREITEWPMFRRARLGITYLPQQPSVFRRLSVADNLNAILETVERDRSRRAERLRGLLAELGLERVAQQRADSLSGGERRRVEIARALVLNPHFVLLDEPFAGVDPLAVMDVQKIISELTDRSIGVIVTDHNVRETLSICDRAFIIKDGAILKLGSPEEIASDPEVREVYLGANFRLD